MLRARGTREQRDEAEAERAAERFVTGAGPDSDMPREPVDPARSARWLSPDGGEPLPDPLRAEYERFFGADLSALRVHTASEGAAAAHAAHAEAFTAGKDVFFGAGRYDPASPRGKRLLAHEVAHAFQQSQPSAEPSISCQLESRDVAAMSTPELELERDRLIAED